MKTFCEIQTSKSMHYTHLPVSGHDWLTSIQLSRDPSMVGSGEGTGAGEGGGKEGNGELHGGLSWCWVLL